MAPGGLRGILGSGVGGVFFVTAGRGGYRVPDPSQVAGGQAVPICVCVCVSRGRVGDQGLIKAFAPLP